MGKDFQAKEVVEEVEEALKFPLSKYMFDSSQEVLTQTSLAQPAIITHQAMILAGMKNRSNDMWEPELLIGHSVGEFSALFASGGISLGDVVRLVHERGKLMEKCIAKENFETGMYAIMPITMEEFENFRRQAQDETKLVCEVAVVNYFGQLVISGHRRACKRAIELASQALSRRLQQVTLKVSAPFHCSLMLPIMPELQQLVDNISIKEMKWPILSNVTTEKIFDTKKFLELLINQTVSPILFGKCVEVAISNSSIDSFLEVGPKEVLSSFVKRINERVMTRFLAVDSFHE
jgi:[acyl-carrier-protein] S-malonyltransferase